MHLGIDASNIRQGGGVTHLVNLLSCATPSEQGFSSVTVWCDQRLAKLVPKKPWLIVRTNKYINGCGFMRFLYQHLWLSLEMSRLGCRLAFFPGGTLPAINLLPAVTMSQNMLPFELGKARLFGTFSIMYLKMLVLYLLQASSFRRANGVIFLTGYAKKSIQKYLKSSSYQAEIPHGIESRFIFKPRIQKSIDSYTFDKPFQFIYTSILMPYKHQLEVIEAMKILRNKGYPVACKFIGPSWGWYAERFKLALKKNDSQGLYLNYLGEISFDNLHIYYRQIDGFIFASSCENLPNILIEAMASGLPIVCSNSGPMPEVLGTNGFYFNPACSNSIANALEDFLNSKNGRSISANDAYAGSMSFSWKNCAIRTFEFLQTCLNSNGSCEN